VATSDAGRARLDDETRLALYALERQATVGDARNAPEDERSVRGEDDPHRARAMVEAWEALRGTRAEEAMRLYVKLLDEDVPKWWDGNLEARRTNAGMCATSGVDAMPVGLARAVVEPSVWRFLEYAGRRPSARFQHAACVAGERMVVVGGTCRGRFIADAHELNLEDLTWRQLTTPAGSERALPACAGHRAVTVGGKTFVVGGRYKGSSDTDVAVYEMRLHEGVDEVEWIRVDATGEETPRARRGASVTAFGDRELVVFGGEDDEGRFLNDVWILDVHASTWRAVKNPTGAIPEPRTEHTATTWGRDTLLIFGGTGRSTKCYDSLYALDLTRGKWTTVTPKGVRPPPRAGHAGVLLRDGRYWALVGGGNNECGLMECCVLDLEETAWLSRTDALAAPPVVGEGMTLCAVRTRDGLEDVIVAFGGYNGHCQNETQILRVSEDFPDHETPTTAAARGETTDARDATGLDSRAHAAADARDSTAADVIVELDAKPAATFAFGTGASVEAYRNENVELRRSLHRLRTDAKLIADAHAQLRSKCDALERELADEKRRAGELEDKVVALAEQLRDVPGAMGSFFHP